MLTIFWIIFTIFILGAVFFDLFLQGRRKKELTLKEAGLWTLCWIALSLVFNLLIYIFMGHQEALEYLTAYLLEKTLSLDNLFVFLLIFSYFDFPSLSQQKILKWGILGAFILRAVFIFGGMWLLEEYHFLFFFFGLFLIYSGLRIFFQKKDERIDPQKNLFVRIAKKFNFLKEDNTENRFFIKRPVFGYYFTTLFVALILVESSDIIFALDSVPAVLAVTRNPFIAYTSNAFAILGLRALYFFIAGLIPKFVYLKKGVTVLLVFIGIKMILSQIRPIPLTFSLIFILTTILSSVILSIIANKKAKL